MDYLDPAKKRARKTRLMVGYGLFAVAIAIATMLLVYVANGYYIDRNTGEVIQNGLIFLDSKPGGAEIYLNGEKQRSKTDSRMVIPGGETYKVDLYREGYRDWTRTVRLEGGDLRRLTYPRLVPNELGTLSTTSLRENPTSVSQSIDKRWVVTSHASSPLNLTIIDTNQDTNTATELIIPAAIISGPPTGLVEIEEWAEDDRFFLAKYTLADSVQYILVDRVDPSAAVNLNVALGVGNVEIQLRDRKRNDFFVYAPLTSQLLTATLEDGISAEPFIDAKVIEFITFESDWVLYVTDSGEEGLTQARFKRGDSDIELRNLLTADSYLLQLAKIGTAPVMAIASTNEDRAIVYNDPQKYLNENESARIPVATTVLRIPGIQDLKISADSSLVIGYGDNNFASHEFEDDYSYTFLIPAPLDAGQEINWIDGQHITFSSGGTQYLADFNGTNINKLVSSIASVGMLADADVEVLYSFNPSSTNAAGVVVPASLVSTSMLIESDR